MSDAYQEIQEAQRFGLLDENPGVQLHGTDAAYAAQGETEEEGEHDMITLSFRRDDPVLEALVAATGKDAQSVVAHALQVGIDLIKIEAMEALTHIYEAKVEDLEDRLDALKAEARAAEVPAMPPRSRLKRFWSALTNPEEA